MIARIEGLLETLNGGAALIGIGGGLTYEVVLPAYTVGRLGNRIGQNVTLHTLHYFESQNQGASITPRLAGFATTDDRKFFELFTTCKGIGHRRALRAMTLDTNTIATAIADRDAALLQSLPEIGRRTAETIIATLHGKVDPYLGGPPPTVRDGDDGTTGEGLAGIGRDALELLVHLGENRSQAIQWIDQALHGGDGKPQDVQELMTVVYQIKSGAPA